MARIRNIVVVTALAEAVQFIIIWLTTSAATAYVLDFRLLTRFVLKVVINGRRHCSERSIAIIAE